MHNRVRMVVASFLVKDLHIGWWHGADWFMTYLRDGDIAQNQLNWRWPAVGTTRALPDLQPDHAVGEVRPGRDLHPALRARTGRRAGRAPARAVARSGRVPKGYRSRSWTTRPSASGAGPLRRGQGMTRAERLAALLEQLVEDGRLDVDEAADRHGVSPATVRPRLPGRPAAAEPHPWRRRAKHHEL